MLFPALIGVALKALGIEAVPHGAACTTASLKPMSVAGPSGRTSPWESNAGTHSFPESTKLVSPWLMGGDAGEAVLKRKSDGPAKNSVSACTGEQSLKVQPTIPVVTLVMLLAWPVVVKLPLSVGPRTSAGEAMSLTS